MSLQALMALLGHVSPQMTSRNAALANGTVRGDYDAAMTKLHQRRPLPIIVAGRSVVPDRVALLNSEMIKTRVAHGYCSRHLAAEPCPTPTSARTATTTRPAPNSYPNSKINSPTHKPSTTTPSTAAGTAKSPDTPA